MSCPFLGQGYLIDTAPRATFTLRFTFADYSRYPRQKQGRARKARLCSFHSLGLHRPDMRAIRRPVRKPVQPCRVVLGSLTAALLAFLDDCRAFLHGVDQIPEFHFFTPCMIAVWSRPIDRPMSA